MRLMRKSTLPAGSPGAFNEIYQGWASAEAEIAPGSRWKPSRYNYVSRFDDGVAIVYNMASDAVFALGPEDGEMLALLEDGIVSSDDPRFAVLAGNGVFVAEEENEDTRLAIVRDAAIYHTGNELKVAINPTMSCNARCEYCFEAGCQSGIMDDGVMEKTARYIASVVEEGGLITYRWFGGEPLLASRVIDRLIAKVNEVATSEFRYKSTILTNALLVDEGLIEKFVGDWHVTEIHLTLDGPRAYHNRIRHYLDSSLDGYQATLDAAQSILGAGIAVVCRINVTKDNIADLEQVVAEFDGMPRRDILRVYPAPVRAHTDAAEEYCYDYEEYDELYRAAFAVLRRHGFFSRIDDFMPKRKVTCCSTRATNEIVIDQDGRLYKCMQTSCRSQKSIGDVERGLVMNAELAKWLNPRTPEECVDCIYMPICQGGCKGFRSLDDPRVSPCTNERYYMDALMGIVHEIAVNGEE